jgi:hypothetical protein
VIDEGIASSKPLELNLLYRSVNLSAVYFMVSTMTDIIESRVMLDIVIGSIKNQKSIAISQNTSNKIEKMGNCIKNKKEGLRIFVEGG